MRQNTATIRDGSFVKAAVRAAVLSRAKSRRLPLQQPSGGFTLAELLVSVGVLVLLVLLATQLLNSAATITTLGHTQMGADAQARQLLDRMSIDFEQMVKRPDVDYYLKSSATGTGVRNLLQPGNDKIAFYSTVLGYYPTGGWQAPVSLVSYRVNAQQKLERMGKGLLWNGSTPSSGSTPPPVVFMPIPLASPIPVGELPVPTPNALPTPAWRNVANLSAAPTPDPDTEVVGPQVFRFEYYYLLKGQTDPVTSTTYNPILTDIPWDTRISGCCSSAAATLCCHTAPEGMQDVAAIVVDIAVIDSKSKALLDTVDPTGGKLARLNGADGSPPALVDFAAGMMSGQLLAQWRATLDANSAGLPPPAISGIRVYERYFYLSPPTLLTP